MGWNSVAVLFNDQTSSMPERMGRAIRGYSIRERDRMSAHFGYGEVVSQDHAGYTQIVAVGGNMGRRLLPTLPASPDDLAALAQILRGHGYVVRKPGQKRGDGPLNWGYWAEQQKEPAP